MDEDAARRRAVGALAEANVRDDAHGRLLRTAAALHVGRVDFGNVGAVERQDFTVIGPDVNLVSRLCTLAAELDEPLLVSERFAARAARALRGVGEFALKGFAGTERVFAPASATLARPVAAS